MEIKIFVLIAVCCVLVQGNSLDSPRLKQQLLAKYLSLARGQDAKRWFWDSSESESNAAEENLAIDKIQSLLYDIAGTLEVFKENTTDSTEPSVTIESVTGATATTDTGTTAPPTTAPPTTGTTATPVTETVGPAETTSGWWNVKRAKENKQQDEQLIRSRLVEILKKELHRQK